jgi:uncharacterized delta-60 repeat protein
MMNVPSVACRILRRFRAARAFLLLAASWISIGAPHGAAFADDGDLDLSFGLFGRAVRGPGIARAVVARGDGSLRVAIDRGWHFGVLALRPNGAVDPDFGDDGVAMVQLPAGAVYPNSAVALFERPGGELLLVANTDDLGSVALVQLTAQGELDAAFGTDGVRFVHPGDSRNAAYAAALQDDGQVVFAGECSDCGATAGADSWIARYSATGSADLGFGTQGSVVFDAVEGDTDYDLASAVAIDDLGRIVVGGSARLGAAERPYVARRRSGDGGPDVTFAGGDGLRTLLALVGQQATGLAIEPVTRRPVVATGRRSTATAPESCAIARLRPDGALDLTFSGDGIVPLNFEEGTNLHEVLLQSDGRIVAAGSIDADLQQLEGFFLVRLLATGALDPSFADDGTRRVEFDLDSDGRDLAAAATLSGGRLVAAGFAMEGGAPQVALLRTASTLIFADGFERGTAGAWTGE